MTAIPELAWMLIYLLIGAGLIYLTWWAINKMALPDPWRTLLLIVIVIIVILFVLRLLGMA